MLHARAEHSCFDDRDFGGTEGARQGRFETQALKLAPLFTRRLHAPAILAPTLVIPSVSRGTRVVGWLEERYLRRPEIHPFGIPDLDQRNLLRSTPTLQLL